VASEKERHSCQINRRTIYYYFEKSRQAKKYRITHLRDNNFRITIPWKGRAPAPEELLFRHRRWISNRVGEEGNRRNLLPELKEGEKIPLLGTPWTLKIQIGSARKSTWMFYPEEQILCLSARDSSGIPKELEHWYKYMAEDYLEKRIPHWAERIKVSPAGFQVKNQRTIWGSCSHRKNLNFNWRIMILSPMAADYLIIHELAHLKHLNHSARYWAVVERFCPDFRTGRKELRDKNHWLLFGR
jgi:predicted metal-dependent hydrolase